MELSEKEAHCIARLLQSSLFGKSLFNGCAFCKFRCRTEKDPAPHLDTIRNKLYATTGVDLGFGSEGSLLFSDFQYKRFLKNANTDIRKYFKNYFNDVQGD